MIGVSGVSGAPLYKQISGELDSDGTYYYIANKSGALKALESYAAELTNALLNSKLPEENRARLAGMIHTVMLVFSLAGLGGELGCGASSIELPAAQGELPYFRNTAFLCHGEKPANGLIWQLFGTRNRDLSADLGAIPADALFAADFEFYPAAAAMTAERLLAGLRRENGAPVINDSTLKVLQNIGGEWSILLIPLRTQGKGNGGLPFGLMIAATDRDGSGYRMLASMLEASPAAPELLLPPLPGMARRDAARIVHADGMTIFYSSMQCVSRLAESQTMLKDTPGYAALAQKLPTEGVGFVYNSERLGELLADFFRRNGELVLPVDLPNQLIIVGRTENGAKAVGNSNWDYNIASLEFSLLPLVGSLTGKVTEMFEDLQFAAQEKANQDACLKNLELLAAAFSQYRAKHHALPPAGELDGLKALLRDGNVTPAQLLCPAASGDAPAASAAALNYGNVSYVYFGPWGKGTNGELPLLADWPLNHPDQFNVLLNNGSIVTFQVENLENCRRLVSFLHSRYKYSEAEFKKMLEIADKLDRMFSED